MGYLGVEIHPDKVLGRVVDSRADFEDFDFWDFMVSKKMIFGGRLGLREAFQAFQEIRKKKSLPGTS